MSLDSILIGQAYKQQLENLHITGNDVVGISKDAFGTFCRKCLRSYDKASGRTVNRDYFESAMMMGIEKAFDKYDPSKRTKFTTYLYSCVQGRLKDYWRSHKREIRRNRKALYLIHPESFPLHQLIEVRDFCDTFGKILWIRNRPELFVMFQLLKLEYTNSEIAKFMMKDEKQIRRWKLQLMEMSKDFSNKEKQV